MPPEEVIEGAAPGSQAGQAAASAGGEATGGQGNEGGAGSEGQQHKTVSMSDIGARARAAVSKVSSDAGGPAAKEAAGGATAQKAGGGDAGGQAGGDGGSAGNSDVITFKAHGKEKAIPIKEAQEILSSYEGFQPEKAKIEQAFAVKLAEVEKPYALVNATVNKYPTVGQSINVLVKHPSLAEKFLGWVTGEIKGGRIHPDTLKAERYEHETTIKAADAGEAEKAAARTKGEQDLAAHLDEIGKDYGQPVKKGDELYKTLVKLCVDNGINDVRLAYKVWLQESGEGEKRALAKAEAERAKNEERTNAQGLRGGRQGGAAAPAAKGSASPDDMRSIGARAKAAIRG